MALTLPANETDMVKFDKFLTSRLCEQPETNIKQMTIKTKINIDLIIHFHILSFVPPQSIFYLSLQSYLFLQILPGLVAVYLLAYPRLQLHES